MSFTLRPQCGLALTLASALVACGGGGPGGGPSGPGGGGSAEFSLEFVDGPADHVSGEQVPTFRIWVLDVHDRRATGLQSGSMSIDLFGPGATLLVSDFQTVSLSFGQGTFTPSVTLDAGDGYFVRARFGNVTADSPPFSVVAARDEVSLSNTPSGEVGLLVDGMNNIGLLQDNDFRTSTGSIEVGVFDSEGATQGVAVFAPDRRPEMVPVTWTGGVDDLSIDLSDPIAIPVTVWVVTGDFSEEEPRVQAALDDLDDAWARERFGVTLGDVQIVDATDQAEDFETFALGIGAPFGPIGDGVGRAAGRFNVYVVTTVRVNQQSVPGFAETGGTAMAVTSTALASAGPRTLGHEFGHNFGLRDTENLEGFLVDPNMMTTGIVATAFTEGQTFRAHFDSRSPLRSFRTGDTFQTLSCDLVEATTHCPALRLRIWSESNGATP